MIHITPEISLIVGLLALLAGAEMLVRSATRIAFRLGLSPLVIGLTVVAFGTSAPEIAVALTGSINNHTGLGFGNIIGSNIFNIFFILGLMSVFVPLSIRRKVIRVDIPLLIAASIVLLVLSLNGHLGLIDGIIMLLLLVGFTSFTLHLGRKEQREIEEDYRNRQKAAREVSLVLQLLFLLFGIVLIGWGADQVVDGSVEIARGWGVDEFIIGLTVIAVGTSLPELVTSIIALLHQHKDMAVGNVVGSSIFNILGVVPVMALITGGGVPVSDSNLILDLPVLIASAVICLPIFFTGYRISRWEGAVFLVYYLAYILFFAIDLGIADSVKRLFRIGLVFVVPVLIIVYVLSTGRTKEKANKA